MPSPINFYHDVSIHVMLVPLYIFVNIVFVLMCRMAYWMLK